ncbi:MAG: hypothetical protein QXJ59_06895 [Thermofilaceae archaeon]
MSNEIWIPASDGKGRYLGHLRDADASRIRGMKGLKTEASGTATIPAGSSYTSVAHGLAWTLKIIRILPLDSLGGRSFWVSNVTSTGFRINTSSADTVSHSFGWSYE